jgi:hypothetical protein
MTQEVAGDLGSTVIRSNGVVNIKFNDIDINKKWPHHSNRQSWWQKHIDNISCRYNSRYNNCPALL